MNVQDPSIPAKSLVIATIIDSLYSKLTKRGGAHDTRFNRYIKIRILEDRGGIGAEYLTYGLKFCMTSALPPSCYLL